MFRIVCLPAGAGDAVVVEYGPARQPRRLLIDAGGRVGWPTLRRLLAARRTDIYDVFVVTHVDEDHIGGALKLLNDPGLASRVRSVWFNGYVHCERGGNVLGPIHGEQFTQRLVDGGFPWNPPWRRPIAQGLGGPVVAPGSGDLPMVQLFGGARVFLLGPLGSHLKALAREWRQVVEKAQLVPGAGAGGEGTAVRQRERTWMPLPDVLDRSALVGLAGRRQRDTSKANASSIAFVLEFGGRRVLLPGDAYGSALAKGVARYAAQVGENRPHFDLVKLPHHGSGANVTASLIDSWTADRFLISTDGTGYLHPHDSAIARLLLTADQARPTFYANYPGGGLARWAERANEVRADFILARSATSGITVSV